MAKFGNWIDVPDGERHRIPVPGQKKKKKKFRCKKCNNTGAVGYDRCIPPNPYICTCRYGKKKLKESAKVEVKTAPEFLEIDGIKYRRTEENRLPKRGEHYYYNHSVIRARGDHTPEDGPRLIYREVESECQRGSRAMRQIEELKQEIKKCEESKEPATGFAECTQCKKYKEETLLLANHLITACDIIERLIEQKDEFLNTLKDIYKKD